MSCHSEPAKNLLLISRAVIDSSQAQNDNFANFSCPSMKTTLQFGGNAILQRELRASLRSARPFALLALYVAVLGAITLSLFPANQQISIDRAPSGENIGKELFGHFIGIQALMILIILPAIASGAISQEREQRTLEPLLLTPLTPLQIVWGKAVGVLSLAGLLLLSTLPLTSLCFLLGGVSPGELVMAYLMLMGLALFTTSIGVYCSARWTNTVKATLACYAMLPFFFAFLVLFGGLGILLSAVMLVFAICGAIVRMWYKWGEKPSGQSTLSHRLGMLWPVLLWIGVPIVTLLLMFLLLADQNAGSIAFGVFGVVYFVFISQIGLQQAAREIARAPEPTIPARQKLEDLQNEWQLATGINDTYLPDAHASAATVSAPRSTPEPAGVWRGSNKSTYGVAPFLPDKLNPVFAKDMRSGVLGKFDYLWRFSYIVVIASQLLLIFLAPPPPTPSVAGEATWFSILAKLHLMVLIVAGAWLGARAIAPEHEQQTLGQLVMTPLSAGQIVSGKISAVMLYTAYVFMLGLPTTLLLAALGAVNWRSALSLVAIQIVLGAFAAAWGLYCSIIMVTTRRALGTALGGVFCLFGSSMMFNALIDFGLLLRNDQLLFSPNAVRFVSALLSPLQLLDVVLAPIAGNMLRSTPALLGMAMPVSLLLYLSLAVLLLLLTSRKFRKYADTI